MSFFQAVSLQFTSSWPYHFMSAAAFSGKHQQEPYEFDADGCDQGMRPCEAFEPFGPNSCEKLGSTNIWLMEDIQLIS